MNLAQTARELLEMEEEAQTLKEWVNPKGKIWTSVALIEEPDERLIVGMRMHIRQLCQALLEAEEVIKFYSQPDRSCSYINKDKTQVHVHGKISLEQGVKARTWLKKHCREGE